MSLSFGSESSGDGDYTRCFICLERVSSKGRLKRNDKSLLEQKSKSVQILCELLELSDSESTDEANSHPNLLQQSLICPECLKQLNSIRETKEKAEKYLLELVNLLSEVMGNLIESSRTTKDKDPPDLHSVDIARNQFTDEIIRKGKRIDLHENNQSFQIQKPNPAETTTQIEPNTDDLLAKFCTLTRIAAYELLELNGFELISSVSSRHSSEEKETSSLDLENSTSQSQSIEATKVSALHFNPSGSSQNTVEAEGTTKDQIQIISFDETPRLILVQEQEDNNKELLSGIIEPQNQSINISHDSGIGNFSDESMVQQHSQDLQEDQSQSDSSSAEESVNNDNEGMETSNLPEESDEEMELETVPSTKETLNCPVPGCKQRFCVKTGDYRLKAHVERYHHGVQKCFKCATCGQGFKEFNSLQTHENTHFDIFPFPCHYENCSKQFRNKRQLTLHEKTYHKQNELPYACEFCGKKFMKKYNCESHRRTHTGETPYTCDICSINFKTASNLAYHRGKVHSDNSKRVKSVCNVCGKSFLSKDGLKGHMFKQHGCSTSSTSDDDGDKSVALTASICEICGYVASSSGGTELKRHILMAHTDKRPEQCSECDKAFKTRSALLSHFRLKHTNNRPYQCEYCSRGFLERSKLERHQLTHTGEKKYACGYCSKKFYDGADVNRHRRRIHRVETGKKSQHLLVPVPERELPGTSGTVAASIQEFVIPISEIGETLTLPTVITVQMKSGTVRSRENTKTDTTSCDIEAVNSVSIVIPTTITPSIP